MFERLTKAQAQKLMGILREGYKDSVEMSRDLSGWMDATKSNVLRASYNRDLNSQAAMRAENTSLRWQLHREALS
jgi:hypothetical protein